MTKTSELHVCPNCKYRKTSKPLCQNCQRYADQRARAAAKRKATVGTPMNLGVKNFLAAIPTPDGFVKTDVVEEWSPKQKWPGVQFVGHDGKTTIKVIMHNVEDEYAPGTGHTDFVTSRGSFSFDRHGVDDSFYVNAEDTPAKVFDELLNQIRRVVESRERHLTSETVPFVGYIVTPDRKVEIAATLRSGGVHSFTPSGFGTGYRFSTNRRKVGTWDVKTAPEAFGKFFGVLTPVYYVTLDCD